MSHETKNAWKGEVHRRTNRVTGTTTLMIDNRDPEETGLDTGDAPWGVVCDEHGTILGVGTRRLAHVSASHPEEWCGACRELAKNGEKYEPPSEDEEDSEPIRIRLTEFQADEVGHRLSVDRETEDRPDWGEIERTGKTTAYLRIEDVDGAIFGITSSRDIFLDNASGGTGTRAANAATRARSLQALVEKILREIGGPEELDPATRRWL